MEYIIAFMTIVSMLGVYAIVLLIPLAILAYLAHLISYYLLIRRIKTRNIVQNCIDLHDTLQRMDDTVRSYLLFMSKPMINKKEK